MRLCEVPGCSHIYLARGMCRMHYERARRGQPLTVTPMVKRTQPERFFDKVEITETCWLWTASLVGRDVAVGEGYGYFHNPGGSYYAHRWAYEFLVGPIPEGLVLDHVYERGCRHRHCVNPDHLEPVTDGENTRRGVEARSA